jgi:hypothetical protein
MGRPPRRTSHSNSARSWSCAATLSIAEVSARLGIPINVVKILVGDMVDVGLVAVYQPRAADQPPSVDLLTRVLHGLRTSL